jgi:hypothetical protein
MAKHHQKFVFPTKEHASFFRGVAGSNEQCNKARFISERAFDSTPNTTDLRWEYLYESDRKADLAFLSGVQHMLFRHSIGSLKHLKDDMR